MSFTETDDGLSSWTVDELAPWRRCVITACAHLKLNLHVLLQDRDVVLMYESQDPVFDAIFAPDVRRNWQMAKAEIDGLIKIWTAMSGARSEFAHWFADPNYRESFAPGIRAQLQRIYALCGATKYEADDAFELLTQGLMWRALEREELILRAPVTDVTHYDESQKEAGHRAEYLQGWLGLSPNDHAA